MVWYGRDGAEGSLAVDAVACGVDEGGGQTGQGDFFRVIMPPTVVATEPVAPCKHVCEGLKRAAVRAVSAAVGAAWLAVGVDVGNAESYARAEPEVLCVLLRGADIWPGLEVYSYSENGRQGKEQRVPTIDPLRVYCYGVMHQAQLLHHTPHTIGIHKGVSLLPQ